MNLIKNILNKQDLLDFITSLDLGIKRQAKQELVDDNLIPKIFIGENKQFKDQITSEKYERPFLTIALKKRGPASASKSDFFSAPHQHGFLDKQDVGGGEYKSVQRKDNLLKLTFRTKTLKEQYFLMTFIERVVDLQQAVFTCNKIQSAETIPHEQITDDMYLLDVYIYIRTTIFVSERDDAIFNTGIISYRSPICKHYSMSSHTCTKIDSEKYLEATDLKCYESAFCKDYEPKINIKINI